MGAIGTFLAIVNSSVEGLPAAVAPGSTNTSMGAARGGCISVEQANFLLQGSSVRHCSARFVGGAVSAKLATMVASDAELTDSYADMVSTQWQRQSQELLACLHLSAVCRTKASWCLTPVCLWLVWLHCCCAFRLAAGEPPTRAC